MRSLRRYVGRSATAGVATVLGLALTSGVALAFWSTSGSGSGTATARSSLNLTGTLSSVTGLYPGGSLAVTVTVANPNPFPVKVTAVTGGTVTTGASGCTTTGVAYTNQTTSNGLGASGFTVPANSAGTALPATTVTMDNTSLSACQGATFTVPVTLAATS